jgi:hypothetical protein
MSPEDAGRINELLDLLEAEGATVSVHDGKMKLAPRKGDPPTPIAKQLAINLRMRFDLVDIEWMSTT